MGTRVLTHRGADAIERCRNPPRSVISPDGWKLNLSETGKCELYHLPSDPGETQDLFYSGDHERLIANPREHIRRWQARTGDDARI